MNVINVPFFFKPYAVNHFKCFEHACQQTYLELMENDTTPFQKGQITGLHPGNKTAYQIAVAKKLD